MLNDPNDTESLFPSFASYVDLMAVLVILFILIASIFIVDNKIKKVEIKNIEIANQSQIKAINFSVEELQKYNKILSIQLDSINTMLLECDSLKPKKIIIPNELNGKVFFGSGSARIKREFYDDLNNFFQIIQNELKNGEYNYVQVEGHTDLDKINRNSQFIDNWDLGAARAIAVVRYFISRGTNPEQLSAVSHSKFKPVLYGNSSYAKKQNRRIEITLLKK